MSEPNENKIEEQIKKGNEAYVRAKKALEGKRAELQTKQAEIRKLTNIIENAEKQAKNLDKKGKKAEAENIRKNTIKPKKDDLRKIEDELIDLKAILENRQKMVDSKLLELREIPGMKDYIDSLVKVRTERKAKDAEEKVTKLNEKKDRLVSIRDVLNENPNQEKQLAGIIKTAEEVKALEEKISKYDKVANRVDNINKRATEIQYHLDEAGKLEGILAGETDPNKQRLLKADIKKHYDQIGGSRESGTKQLAALAKERTEAQDKVPTDPKDIPTAAERTELETKKQEISSKKQSLVSFMQSKNPQITAQDIDDIVNGEIVHSKTKKGDMINVGETLNRQIAGVEKDVKLTRAAARIQGIDDPERGEGNEGPGGPGGDPGSKPKWWQLVKRAKLFFERRKQKRLEEAGIYEDHEGGAPAEGEHEEGSPDREEAPSQFKDSLKYEVVRDMLDQATDEKMAEAVTEIEQEDAAREAAEQEEREEEEEPER